MTHTQGLELAELYRQAFPNKFENDKWVVSITIGLSPLNVGKAAEEELANNLGAYDWKFGFVRNPNLQKEIDGNNTPEEATKKRWSNSEGVLKCSLAFDAGNVAVRTTNYKLAKQFIPMIELYLKY